MEDLFSFIAHAICRTKQGCQWCTSWQGTWSLQGIH